MIQVGEWPRELIICLLDLLINDFDEFDEVIFQGVERPNEIIFCIPGIQKAAWMKSWK
jgi:hypothetical protein